MNINTGEIVAIPDGTPMPDNMLPISPEVFQEVQEGLAEGKHLLDILSQIHIPEPLRRWATRKKKGNNVRTVRQREAAKAKKKKRQEARRARKANRR